MLTIETFGRINDPAELKIQTPQGLDAGTRN